MRAEEIDDIPHAPYVKGKNFLPNPIVVNGIPDYADGVKNPKIIGTPDYEIFWQEQIYRCINGYQTGGIFLPGRFYYYMNFNSMLTINGVITPDFCDLHLELCYIIEWCKKNQKNLVIGKKRRAGVSEFTQKAVIDHGFRFNEVYQGGIAAGQKKYAEDFMTKWSDSESLLVPELKVNTLLKNPDEVVSGYKITENGKDVEKNNGCKLLVRTMHNNPNMFKGLFLNDAVAEESGEFEHLIEWIAATEDCLVDGDVQVGTFYIYGTGGRIEKGSKDFKIVWENPDEYNCVKFLIAGDRFKKPFYGGATRNGKDISVIPNLLKKYKAYQCVGMEDREAALEHIKKKRIELKKGKLEKYLKYCQNNPLDESEIFRKTNSNDFDTELLNAQDFSINSNKPRYSKYKLEWDRDIDGKIKTPLKVTAHPAKDLDDEKDCILILDGYHPAKQYQNLYVAGIDGYDQDKAASSKSLGAMCVITRKNTFGIPHNMPVAVIRTRPKRKEIFFEMCVKLSVYYDLVRNTLGDLAHSSGLLKTYSEMGCIKYLAPRPTKFESENTQQAHEYWVRLTTYSRPMRTGLMQSAIFDHSTNIWFPDLIKELMDFDETEDDSDNDLADAYGIALMQDVSETAPVRDKKETNQNNPYSFGCWIEENGELVYKEEFVDSNQRSRPDNPEKDFNGFGS
jgi:hypothetical protein